MYKTKARQCTKCYGKGTIYKIKKDGTRWKNPTKCKSCSGKGYTLIPLHKIAGLHMNPRDVLDVSANGFATDKTTLIRLLGVAKHNGNERAVKFLTSAVRLNAVDVYLSSFVGGIQRNTRSNRLLHPKFNQCVTRTTRLSSSDPNFQNQPRGSTFPVRAVVVSRFENGKIMQADYSQLEFRVAAQLCGDEKMLKDILEGQDVHKYTASIIFDKAEADVTKEERTAAKAHTFKPLYGGFSGTPREMAYYKAFVEKYPKLGAWHADLQTEAISHGIVRLYTGQQFAFPDTKRLSSGAATNAPSIKNYPVQGVAGGCIVPLALVDLYNKLKDSKSKSLIINTVHDSVVVDIYPGEELQVANMMYDSMTQVSQKFEELYNVKWSVPLEVDLEIGNNWLNMKNYSLT
jgi:DNA polymerase I-like protein with 3'-5' exonuclease and polymerase domains